MGTHMKTTIDIADGLLTEARAHAQREGLTLRAVIEEGLRRVLKDRLEDDEPFELLVYGDPDAADGQEAIDAALREAREGRDFPELEHLFR